MKRFKIERGRGITYWAVRQKALRNALNVTSFKEDAIRTIISNYYYYYYC